MAALPLAAALPAVAAEAGLEDYRPAFAPARTEDGRPLVAIRRFRLAGKPHVLTVEVPDFRTRIRPEEWISWELGPDAAASYAALLDALTGPPHPVENAGLTHARGAAEGFFLTVDMCPSSKPFEAGFFAALAARAAHDGRAMPVAISISGYWALDHAAEFASLIERQRLGQLDITWVNHSYAHRYVRGVPDHENFLLLPHTDFEQEVLRTERLLIARGLTPSVFFRFPGLVSNERLMAALRRLGLVPLGADAWLAKLQKPRPGSIVLVHGNGNEPFGIHEARRYLADATQRWLPLNEALAG